MTASLQQLIIQDVQVQHQQEVQLQIRTVELTTQIREIGIIIQLQVEDLLELVFTQD